MKLDFKVASANITGQNVTATVNGQNIPAVVDCLEVELVSDTHGSLRLRFVGSEKEEATKLFVVDSKHTWTL